MIRIIKGHAGSICKARCDAPGCDTRDERVIDHVNGRPTNAGRYAWKLHDAGWAITTGGGEVIEVLCPRCAAAGRKREAGDEAF